MSNIDEELSKYKKLVQDKDDEQRRINEARAKIIELERQKYQETLDRAMAEKLAKERAIHNKVDKEYSPVFVKLGSKFIQADKFWFTADRQLIGCGTDDKTGTYKFFKISEGNDEVFVETYMPR